MSKLRWTYGVTTVPGRLTELLPATLRSLAAAGFDAPRLFIDGATEPAVNRCNYHTYDRTYRFPSIGAYGNWLLALSELYIRDPACDRYAIFQDDVSAVKNLRTYLDQSPFPERGYWNLYSALDNESAPALAGPHGWREGCPMMLHPKKQRGLGALGLVFNREGVQMLLRQPHIVNKPAAAYRPKRCIDGAVVEAMNAIGWRERVHLPSLLQHMGMVSSLGNHPHPISVSFPGEDFDALSLL